MSDFLRLGGAPALRDIIDAFVDLCFDDMMIGYLFRRASRERVKRFEFEHAAEHLGAGIVYEGRPLDTAHRAHRIMGGQFDRRMTILREVLEEKGAPEDIRAAWLAYHESLRDQVTTDPRGMCTAVSGPTPGPSR
jgi:hemoglobin